MDIEFSLQILKIDNILILIEKHVFFIAETKGSMSTLDLRPAEKAKIDCAKKLFNEMSTSKVKYGKVSSYEDLLNIISLI